MTDYEDLAFEPPLTVEGLKKWIEKHGKEEEKGIYTFVAENSNILSIDTNGEIVEIYTSEESFVYSGKPAQVKRVLEAMLND